MATTIQRGLGGLAMVAAVALLATATAAPGRAADSGGARTAAPARLADTGLYADFAARRVARDVLAWTPQYPLWSDGATKRRWLRLPPGTAIDARDPDAWVFPAGTRLWKEFSFGRRVETRYMERRADGSWIYATYVWSADGRDAVLAPDAGVRAAVAVGGGAAHDVPSVDDCLACHGAGKTPVLGFSALQLSPDRDPLAPHAERLAPGAVDLVGAVERGLVKRLPAAVLRDAPRVRAATPTARAAMGYLHGNCASCHDARGELASLGLDLAQRIAPAAGEGPIATAVGVPSRYRPAGATGAWSRVEPGHPDRSVLAHRLGSRSPAAQMPPLGTHVVDEQAAALVRSWIAELQPRRDPDPLLVAAPRSPAAP